MCYFRRGDIPTPLLALADKHQSKTFCFPVSLHFRDLMDRCHPSAVAEDEAEIKSEPVTEEPAAKEPAEPAAAAVAVAVAETPAAAPTDVEMAEADVKPEAGASPSTDKKEDGSDKKEGTPEKAAEKAEKAADKPTTTKTEKLEAKAEGAAKNADEDAAASEQMSSKQKQQLNQRELFLSRQVETLPATNIRGKCSVTLLNETESFSAYLEKEDAFFYTLVYDPVQKTLLADRGEIRVGSRYQAEATPLLKEGSYNNLL